MRNQADTQQVELYGTGGMRFALGFRVLASDWDGDGMPNSYEAQYPFLDPANGTDGTNDWDGDGMRDNAEYVAATAPDNANDVFKASGVSNSASVFTVRFPAKAGRLYHVWHENRSLTAPAWSNATPGGITVPANTVYTWSDDGTGTGSAPFGSTQRFYRVDVNLAP